MARLRSMKTLLGCALLWLCASIASWASEYHGLVFFNGVPVPGATVTVTKGSKHFRTVTDRQGLYEFADLGDGVWKIEIEMSGFSTLDGEVTVVTDQGTAVLGPQDSVHIAPKEMRMVENRSNAVATMLVIVSNAKVAP